MTYGRIDLRENRPDVYLETYISDSLPNVTRKAILVIPGGGYGGVCADREGEPIALAFMPYGSTASCFTTPWVVRSLTPLSCAR